MLSRKIKIIKVLNIAQIKNNPASIFVKIFYEKNSPPTETYGHNPNNGYSSCLSAIKTAFINQIVV